MAQNVSMFSKKCCQDIKKVELGVVSAGFANLGLVYKGTADWVRKCN